MIVPNQSKLRVAFCILVVFLIYHPNAHGTFKEWLSKKLPYKLPPEKLSLEKLKPESAIAVLDRNGEILFYLPTLKLHFYKPISEISEDLQKFVVLSEDAKFYSHEGFDMEEIQNSLKANLSSNKVKRGGSTITQQLAKNLFLDKKRSMTRKLFEVPWTMQLERDFTKKQLLELYLNIIEWGPGVYGAEAASRHFFDKSAKDLTPRQALYLAMIVPGPVRFDAFGNPKAEAFLETKKRTFVDRIYSEKKITTEERDVLSAPGFELASTDNANRKFPLQHQARYAGSWADSNWKELANYLSKPSMKNKIVDQSIQIPLVKNPDASIFNLPLTKGSSLKASYLVLRDERGMVAYKKLPKSEKIAEGTPLPSGLTVENDFSLDEVFYVAPIAPSFSSSSSESVEGG